MKDLFKSSFAKNSSKLISSGIVGQFIAFLTYPIITRYYSDIQFGELSIYLSYTAIIANIISLRYEQAVHIPKPERDATSLLLLAIASLALIVPIGLIFHALNVTYLNISTTTFTSIIAGSLIVASSRIMIAGNNRDKVYKPISYTKVSNSAGSSIFQLLFIPFLKQGLIVGKILGDFIGFIISFYHQMPKIVRQINEVKVAQLRQLARKFKKFPLVNMPHALLNNTGVRLPVIILSAYFGVGFIGQYELAYRVGFAPIMLISGSLYLVFTQKFSEKARKGESISSFLNMFLGYVLLAGLALVIFTPLYDDLFMILFGEEWQTAGILFQYLVPAFLMTLLVSPVVYIPQYFGYQKEALYFEIGFVILRIVVLYLGAYYLSNRLTILIFSISSALYLIIQLHWIRSIAKKHDQP